MGDGRWVNTGRWLSLVNSSLRCATTVWLLVFIQMIRLQYWLVTWNVSYRTQQNLSLSFLGTILLACQSSKFVFARKTERTKWMFIHVRSVMVSLSVSLSIVMQNYRWRTQRMTIDCLAKINRSCLAAKMKICLNMYLNLLGTFKTRHNNNEFVLELPATW